jgi:SPP1 gp7 family putative phage head morphogenesis protein
MKEPTNNQLLRLYIRRSLLLIRIANGMSAENNRELRALSAKISAQLAEHSIPPRGRLQRAAVVREVESTIVQTYSRISTIQIQALREVTAAEAAFVQRVGAYANAPTKQTLARAAASMLFAGAPVEAHWSAEAQRVGFRIGSEMRIGWQAGDDFKTLRDRVIGSGRPGQERGGVMQGARDNARRITDTGTQRAAMVGRAEVHRANGVQALRWYAILDEKVCPNCGMRAGKLYTVDGEPIGHDVPMIQEPPFHFWCRCMLIPEKYDGPVPNNSGEDGESFDSFLSSLSQKEQGEVLGVGRAEMWRDGQISLGDLIGQNGLVLPLSALRNP